MSEWKDRITNGCRFYAHFRDLGDKERPHPCVEVIGRLSRFEIKAMQSVEMIRAFRVQHESGDERETAMDLLIPDMMRKLMDARAARSVSTGERDE